MGTDINFLTLSSRTQDRRSRRSYLIVKGLSMGTPLPFFFSGLRSSDLNVDVVY